MGKIVNFFKKIKTKKEEDESLFDEAALIRFHFLLDHAPSILDAYDNTKIVHNYRYSAISWEDFKHQIEEKYGYFFNDSCSTMATFDDLPGTGRILDNYFFQPVGKRVDKTLLSMELRFFRNPKKEARRILTLLQNSEFAGEYLRPPGELAATSVPVGGIERFIREDSAVDKSCYHLFNEFRYSTKAVKAFQRLLLQAR